MNHQGKHIKSRLHSYAEARTQKSVSMGLRVNCLDNRYKTKFSALNTETYVSPVYDTANSSVSRIFDTEVYNLTYALHVYVSWPGKM